MSAFIVISVKESLNWIVDGIKNCLPHNPKVVTYLSTGKIKKIRENYYQYEYTVFSKHGGEGNSDKAISEEKESDTPSNLFSNQIAQLLNVSENDGEQINLFLLDNPIDDEEFNQSSWLVDEIRKVYTSRRATNFQLVRVLFSYDIDKPKDVNRHLSKMVLRQLTKINLDDTDDFLSRILYIDNQNRNGAAMCTNEQEHRIMIPRMLCDLMMLLSNKDDSCNVSAAINGQTHLFAVGYSECMYYHDDVFRYYELASRRDLLSYLLEAKNDEESLNYDKYPVGLRDRLERLKPVYAEISYKDEINKYPNSIDKTIDDIVVSFKNDIVKIRKEALDDAAEKDKEETKHIIISHLKANDLISLAVSEEDLEENYLSIAKDANVDIVSFSVKKAVEQAQKEYPEYIDRNQIYEEYKNEDEEGEDFEGTDLESNVKAYNRLIEYIQTKQFKKYIKDQCESKDKIVGSSTGSVVKARKPCFMKRLFCRKKKAEISTESDVALKSTLITRDWQSLRKRIGSISELYSNREGYHRLNEKVKSMLSEVNELNNKIHNFKLTSHCSSVDGLIDLEKMKEFHQTGREARLSDIVEQWNHRDDNGKTYDAFFEELEEKNKGEIFGFYYINWSNPFDFVKSIDLQKVCEGLKRKSLPFVYTYTLAPNAENLTSYFFYTDNERWHEDLNQKRVALKDDIMVQSALSQHICSKICMFQFLQMSRQLIDGLVDCYDEDDTE